MTWRVIRDVKQTSPGSRHGTDLHRSGLLLGWGQFGDDFHEVARARAEFQYRRPARPARRDGRSGREPLRPQWRHPHSHRRWRLARRSGRPDRRRGRAGPGLDADRHQSPRHPYRLEQFHSVLVQLVEPIADHRPAGRVARFRRRGGQGDRGSVGRGVPGLGAELSGADRGAVHRRGEHGLRRRRFEHGALLLSGRPEGLHRSELLRPASRAVRRAGRFRPGLCAGP